MLVELLTITVETFFSYREILNLHLSFTDATCTMTWLIFMEYLCHKRPRMSSVRCYHNPVLSSFMTYHRVCNKSNKTDAISGAGSAYPSGAPEFTRFFQVVFCVVFCRSLFGHCPSYDFQFLITPLVLSNLSYLNSICHICCFHSSSFHIKILVFFSHFFCLLVVPKITLIFPVWHLFV